MTIFARYEGLLAHFASGTYNKGVEVIILAVIVGLGIAGFATQNTDSTVIQVASYVSPEIPLYVVVVGALLLGLLLAWVFSLVHSFSSAITIHGKDNTIKDGEKTILELTKKVHQLELENTRLETETGHISRDEKSI